MVFGFLLLTTLAFSIGCGTDTYDERFQQRSSELKNQNDTYDN